MHIYINSRKSKFRYNDRIHDIGCFEGIALQRGQGDSLEWWKYSVLLMMVIHKHKPLGKVNYVIKIRSFISCFYT